MDHDTMIYKFNIDVDVHILKIFIHHKWEQKKKNNN